MWILKFLPDWLFYALFFIGVIGVAVTYLLKFIPIPALYIYRTPIQIISILLVAFGTFMSGAIWNEDAWKARVAQLEKEAAEANAKSGQVTVETVTKYVDRTKVIREKGEQIVRVVDREVVKYNDICKMPEEVVRIHNEAAKGSIK
jgi:hypothetical protein